MEISFQNPWFLWLLASAPLLFFLHLLSIRRMRHRALAFGNYVALEKIAGRPMTTHHLFPFLLRALMLVCLIFSVAGASITYSGKKSLSDIVIAIDSSSSMQANDFSPSRLESAKEAARQFIGLLPPDADIGIVSFAGTSYVEQRPTTNNRAILESIGRISINPVGGTDIGNAIITSSNLLQGEKAKTVVLITDGRSNVGVPVGDAVTYASKNSIVIHTIGIGTESGGVVEGINLTTGIDAEELRGIAQSTGGIYFQAANESSLADAYTEISLTQVGEKTKNLSLILLVAVIALLFIDWSVVSAKYGVIP